MKTRLLAFMVAAMLSSEAWAAPASVNLDSDKGQITLDSPVKIYDDGGADGNIGNNIEATVTLLPANAGEKVKVVVDSYKTGYTDYLYIYNGSAVKDAADYTIKGSNTGTTAVNQVISTAADGSLTLKFKTASSHYSGYAGFELTASSYALKDLEVASIEVSGLATEAVRGATDVAAGQIQLNVEGDRSTTTVSGVSGKITGADNIAAIKAWYTGTVKGFSPTRCLGTATVDGSDFTVSFTSPVEIDTYGTDYMYLTVDVADNAPAGAEISLGDIALTASPKSPASTEKVTLSVKSGFAGGTFTIGSSAGADYATFAEAIGAISTAVEGAVTFNIEPGTYAEDIVIKDITGTRADRPITFRAAGEGVYIPGKGYPYSGTEYSHPYAGIVTVENTPYVTFDGINFNPDTNYPRTLWLVGASRHCTVKDCTFANEIQTGSRGNSRVHIYTDAVSNTWGTNADYLTVDGCTFAGNKIAMQVEGAHGYVAGDRIYGTVITNCTFTDNGSKAIYIYQAEDVTVSNCRVTTTQAVQDTGYAAIDLARVTGKADIYANRIELGHEKYGQGLWIRYDCDGGARHMRVYNNSIAMTSAANASTYGIQLSADSRNIDIVHNSVLVSGTNGQCLGITGNYATYGINLTNNLFQNAATAGNVINIGAKTTFSQPVAMSGNVFHAESGAVCNSTDFPTTGYITEQAKFLAATDLHLTEAGGMQCGSPVEYVGKDIEGKWRPAENVTAGAYEFAPLEVVTPVMAEGYPKATDVKPYSLTALARWNVSGNAYALIKESTEAAPAASDVIAEGKRTAITADADATFAFESLSDQTAYKVYFVAVSGLEAQSEVATLDVTTARYIAPLTVTIDTEEYEDEVEHTVGQTITVHPAIAGGDKPYAYSWTDRQGREVGTDESLVYELTRPDRFTLTVTSADGQTASAYVLITAYGCKDDADFEDNDLAPESSWKGYADRDMMVYPWYSGGFSFDNSYMAAYSSYSGFVYSNSTSTEFESYVDDCNLVTGGGYGNSAGFAVAFNYTPYYIHVLADPEGAKLDCVYVTNNMYVYTSAAKGDGFNQPFTDGNFIKVTFTGDDPEGTPVECDLARHTGGKLEALTDWKRVDLSPLGKVTKVAVGVKGHNDFVPTYVALDHLCYDRTAGVNGVATDSRVVDRISYHTPDGRHVPATALTPGLYICTKVYTDGTSTSEKAIIK